MDGLYRTADQHQQSMTLTHRGLTDLQAFVPQRMRQTQNKAMTMDRDPPAGQRIPKTYKRYLGDKLPMLISQMRQDGSSIEDIRKQMDARLFKSIDKS